MTRGYTRRLMLAAMALAIGASTWAQAPAGTDAADEAQAPLRYTPRETTVALVPAVNVSGEKNKDQNAAQAARADEELARLFRERGFILVPETAVAAAIRDQKIDLADEEFHNRATLYRIGEALGADLVAFVTITGVDQDHEERLTGQRRQGSATVKAWLLDVKQQRHILSAKTQEAAAETLPHLMRGSKMIRRAVARATERAFKDFLEDFPKEKK